GRYTVPKEYRRFYQYGDHATDPSPESFRFLYLVEYNARGVEKSRDKLFSSEITDVQQHKQPGQAGIGLMIYCTSDKGSVPPHIYLDCEDLGDPSGIKIYKTLNQGGCGVRGYPSPVAKLMSSFRGRLMERGAATELVPIGWIYR